MSAAGSDVSEEGEVRGTYVSKAERADHYH